MPECLLVALPSALNYDASSPVPQWQLCRKHQTCTGARSRYAVPRRGQNHCPRTVRRLRTTPRPPVAGLAEASSVDLDGLDSHALLRAARVG